MTSATVVAALDLGSASPEQWVPLRQVEERANWTPNQAESELAGLTMMVKHRFQRSNWPFQAEWGVGGEKQSYYRVPADVAEIWNRLAEADGDLGANLEVEETVGADTASNTPAG